MVNTLTVALQRELDVAQSSPILQQVGGCIGQDIVGLGGFEKELQLNTVLPRAGDHPRARRVLLVCLRGSRW